MILILLFALLAGFATVLSPCILPVLPAILSASTSGGKARPLGVILGLLVSFVFFTLTLTWLVHAFGISANILRYAAIAIIALFGLVMIFPKWSDTFARWTSAIAGTGSKLQSYGKQEGFISGCIVGAALGLVWTPCAGPILGAITTLVATQKVTLGVVAMTGAYALGAAIPLFMIAYGGQRVLKIPSLARHSEGIRQGFGALMLLTAVALYFNWDSTFQQAVVNYLPELQVENNKTVQKELATLRSRPMQKEGEAPPIVGITGWINTEPLTLDQLKGKVVLVDFWTYSCINCLRTLPYLEKWYAEYKDQGLVILGVHTPEFEFEKDYENVKAATERLHVAYPVLMDNNYATWNSYDNEYWPAHYLIDRQGNLIETHFGEGGYVETENAIRKLLGLQPLEGVEEKPMVVAVQTPETYLGYQRGRSYTGTIYRDETHEYDMPKPGMDEVSLKGLWTVGGEQITSESEMSDLSLNFKANRVYLVLKGKGSIGVYLDDKEAGKVEVVEPKKYDILNLHGEGGTHLLRLRVPKGVEVYAFTFGMEE